MRLSESIQYTDRIQPIDCSANELPEGALLTLTGWGINSVRILFKTHKKTHYQHIISEWMDSGHFANNRCQLFDKR